MRERLKLIALVLCIFGAGACADMMDEDSSVAKAGGDFGGYMDVDADADADLGPMDGEADDGQSPEQEQTAEYAAPMGAGRFVFVPDEARDAVVVVDSETLEIRVVEVGSRPTYMVTLNAGEAPRVAVINLNSDEVTVIQMNADATFDTWDIPVRPDTNALAPSPDGRFIIAFHDPNQTAVSGTPGTDQEISILDVESGESWERSVGMRPWKVVYNEAVTRAFVVTEEGINVVDLEDLNAERTDPIRLFESGSYTAETADIEITADGLMAIGRTSGTREIKAAWLDGSETELTYTLPAVPTDLDLSRDGTFGMVVLRELGQVAFFDLPLQESAESPFTYVGLEGRIAGLATLSRDGDHVLLFTSAAGEDIDRRRLTLMSREEEGWTISSAVLKRQIEAVVTVDSEDGTTDTAVVIHKQYSSEDKPYAYTLVTLPGLMTKLQQLATRPGQLLFTPDGGYGFLLLKESRATEKINLDTLIVNEISLSSAPVAAGYAGTTDKVFVAQDHPAGRMTFIGVADDSLKTITGYNLNEEIEVSE